MEAQIKEIIKDKEISTIKELKVTGCESSNVSGLSEDYKSLETLQVKSVGLTTLKSFPRLVNLRNLELTDNQLSEGLDALANLPKLHTIDLSGNKIKDLDVLQPLAELSTLTSLNLKGCDVTEIKDYRKKIFNLIPTLKTLDSVAKEKEIEEDDDDCEEIEEVEDEDEADDESLGEEEEDDEDAGSVPLSAIYNSINEEDDEEEDDDFEAGDVDEEEDLDEEEGDEDIAVANLSVEKVDGKTRGKKRKEPEEKGEEKESKK